jgi:glucose/arabinose dehydrogenase
LVEVARVSAPVALAMRPGDEALYVAEKGGRVRAVRGGAVDATPVLDISSQVSTGGEQGLLGLAFPPDGAFLYVYFTNRAGDSRLVEYPFDGRRADPGGAREMLAVDQPFANHNGGQLSFGPDGRLYLGLGDGGSGNDPFDNAQNLGTLLGKILRLDARPGDGRPYGVPPDNPFVGRAGARPEIWVYGLRNPWRFSFDRQSGDLWIGDVGQSTLEEIDFRPAGEASGTNFGWAAYEGSRRHKATVDAPGAVGPVHEYPTRDDGACAVTGGYVYRGTRIPALTGAYLYADYCIGDIIALRLTNGRVTDVQPLGINADQLSSVGEDHHGELLVLTLTGRIHRIEPA